MNRQPFLIASFIHFFKKNTTKGVPPIQLEKANVNTFL